MKLYYDCTCGISGDMLYEASAALVKGIDENNNFVEEQLEKLTFPEGEYPGKRAYGEVIDIIEGAELDKKTEATAKAIYHHLALAEAKVHKTLIKEMHFHEVARDEAIKNIVGFAAALSELNAKGLYCSAIHDGRGTVECAHGRVEIPAPATAVMMNKSHYVFVTEDVPEEMVTPTGMAMMLGAKIDYTWRVPEGEILAQAQARGRRQTGKAGLRAFAIK